MKTVETTFARFRANLKAYCEQAVADREPICVRRRNGKDVILMAADEYDGLAETAHLLSSPKNGTGGKNDGRTLIHCCVRTS